VLLLVNSCVKRTTEDGLTKAETLLVVKETPAGVEKSWFSVLNVRKELGMNSLSFSV
jgi:hypothetical protein